MRHSHLPRRPARHRRHHARGPDERAQGRRQEEGGREDRHLRRGRGGHRHHEAAALRGLPGHHDVRPQGRDLPGPRGPELDQDEMAEVTNLSRKAGTLADMLVGADVFIGVSAPGYRHDRDGQDHEQGRDHLRLREPDAGDLPGRRRRRAAQGSFRPAAATIRTRSTTCSPSPASSAARSTCGPATSTRR